MRTYTTSAPGKVILLGEHAVNRRQAALATAVNLRVLCTLKVRQDDVYSLRFGTLESTTTRSELERFRQDVDSCRESGDHEGLRTRTAEDFFAPTRYVLARLVGRAVLPGLDAEWRSELPVGSGLGSGAAASASLLQAVSDASGLALSAGEVAELAWHGDIVAHGGVASGLDSGACALGGLTLYSLQRGPRVFSDVSAPLLVLGDTRVQAHTRKVNARVRALLAAHPARAHLFREIGLLVEEAVRALALGDMETLGGLLSLNQLVLEKLGVSSPEIERLTDAALEAGALGAKLSGSGGGGIIIALAPEGKLQEVAHAIERAGGRALVAETNAPGVRSEPDISKEAHT